jgi:hypothetical protein
MSLSELGCTTTGLSLARIADRTVYWLIEARSREREMLIIYLKASKILNNNNINNKNNNNNNSNDNSSDHLSEVA